MKHYLFKILFAVVILHAADAGAQRRLLIAPFSDDSGYRGPWNIGEGVSVMVGDLLAGDDYYQIIPMDSVLTTLYVPEKRSLWRTIIAPFSNRDLKNRRYSEREVLDAANKLGADYAIIGTVDRFGMTRGGVGDPFLASYKQFSARVSVSNVRVINVGTGLNMGTVRGEADETNRGVALELLGRPRDLDIEFWKMDYLEFGSKEFISTMLGQVTIEALNEAQKDIRSIVARPDHEWFTQKKFRILSVDAGFAVINAGGADGIVAGDRYNVFTPDSGVRVGKINVLTVWSEHVSKTEILEGRDEIRPNDIIMPEF